MEMGISFKANHRQGGDGYIYARLLRVSSATRDGDHDKSGQRKPNASIKRQSLAAIYDCKARQPQLHALYPVVAANDEEERAVFIIHSRARSKIKLSHKSVCVCRDQHSLPLRVPAARAGRPLARGRGCGDLLHRDAVAGPGRAGAELRGAGAGGGRHGPVGSGPTSSTNWQRAG